MFLPEGHDPDTLVGEEGREAFEARLDQAMPLSEYLVQELSSQVDLAHADGRARFAETARPLVAKVPEGVFRELLVERLAEAIRLPANRLRELWSGDATVPSEGQRFGARVGTDRDAPRSSGAARTSGRGGLMRQVVLALVHHPKVGARLADADLEILSSLDEPGAEILRELVNDLRGRPCANTGQLLERWRERPEAERLSRLAVAESLIPTDEAALQEVRNALARMRDEQRLRRLDALLEREKSSGLSAAERTELQQLMSGRTRGPGRA